MAKAEFTWTKDHFLRQRPGKLAKGSHGEKI
jgi:hypothetical protein